jgi:hypothetical protein
MSDDIIKRDQNWYALQDLMSLLALYALIAKLLR